MNGQNLDSQAKGRPKNRIGVIICGHVWLHVDQKIRDWIKNHPNEKVLDRTPIVFWKAEDIAAD